VVDASFLNLKKTSLKRLYYILLTVAITAAAIRCTTIDLYERTVPVPGHAWSSTFKPSFDFTIKGSSARYDVYLILRHNEKYGFNNIYLNLLVKIPGVDSVMKLRREVVIADNEGWKAASGMDDIYEQRLPLAEIPAMKPGNYNFTLEQIMREDPLQHVLDVGIRIERKQLQ